MRITLLRTALLALSFLTAGIASAQSTLRYASIDEPPTLDIQVATSRITSVIGHHIFEGLYTFTSSNEPVPMLATGETISADGKTITIGIRDDVKFHNGQPMTSEDVVASLTRWGEFGSRGKLLWSKVAGISATGPYEVTITLAETFGPWKNLLANLNGGPSILPASIVAGKDKTPVSQEEYIGTGPYKFSQWQSNRYIELVRFDDYSSLDTPADGYSGKKEAIIDRIRFVPVPDIGTRMSGVRAGDYDYAELMPGDLLADLEADDSVRTLVNGGPLFGLVFMNSSGGMLETNYPLRQAIQTALNKEDALRSSIGPEALWRANGSIFPEGNFWASDNGVDQFSIGDADKARAMAEAAGYDGTPIRFMVSQAYQFHYDSAQVYKRQMEAAGFEVDLQVYDWPTLTKKRAQPGEWDMFFTHHGFVPDPILVSVLNESYPGWWQTDERNVLVSKLTGTSDPIERQKIWADIQSLIYEQVPIIKTGDVFTYDIASPALKGLPESSMNWPVLWNLSK